MKWPLLLSGVRNSLNNAESGFGFRPANLQKKFCAINANTAAATCKPDYKNLALPNASVLCDRNSNQLWTTQNYHPILAGDGRIREANSFLIGDAFVAADGARDPILSIDKSRHFGQVYNVDTKTNSLKSKLVLAEGFGYMNRRLLRKQIPGDLL